MYKLLIFDLDGTLADTGQDIANAINYALEPFGGRTYSVEETKAMVGSGITSLLESLIPFDDANTANFSQIIKREGEGISAKELVTRRFLDYYDNHLMDHTVVYPHVKETLEKLADYRKAVISNKREIYSKRVLDGIGLSAFFDVVFGSDSVPEKKPSPVPILMLLKHFDVSPDETVMIGDSNFDIEAGKAAGVTVIAVTYGFRKREALKDADLIIDRFDDILRVLPDIQSEM